MKKIMRRYLVWLILGGILLENAWSNEIDTDLVAHYLLDANANDSWTNALHGVNVGASGATNRFGTALQALKFDGVNDYLNMGQKSAWAFTTNSFSCTFWFKTEVVAVRKVGLLTLQAGSNDIEFSIGYGSRWATSEVDDDKLGIGVNYTSDQGFWGADVIGTTSVSDGKWHHVALTRNGDEWAIYLDGQQEPEATVSYPFSSDNGTLLVGTHIPSDRFFKGHIDDIRVYSRGLPLETIATLADKPIVHIWTAMEITWLSESGVVYQVEWTDTLPSTTWFNLGAPVVGDGDNKTVFDSIQTEQEKFYRISSP